MEEMKEVVVEKQSIAKRLAKLGVNKAAEKITEAQLFLDKTKVAYRLYRFLTPERIEAFNNKLKKDTMKEDKNSYYYKSLKFIPLDEYEDIPPENVLDRLERAQERGCFDTFEVCKIDSVKQIKDPIIFGCIKDCPDKFFIAQWDDDITVDEIMNGDTSKFKTKK